MENTKKTIDNVKVNAVLKEFINSFEYITKNNGERILALKDTASEDMRKLTFDIAFDNISVTNISLDHAYRILEGVLGSFENFYPENEAELFDIDRAATEIDAPIYTAELLSFLVVGTVEEIEESMRGNDTDSICAAIMYWYQSKARDMAYSAFEGIKAIAEARAQQ